MNYRRINRKDESIQSLPKWLGLSSLGLLILATFVLMFIWKPWQPTNIRDHENTQQTLSYTEDAHRNYQFYELLPEQEIVPIIPEKSTSTTPPEAKVVAKSAVESSKALTTSDKADAQQYVLINSFDNEDQANQQRERILSMGLSVKIVTHSENDKTWYRVVSGPFTTLEHATAAKQTLYKQGFDSILSQVSIQSS